MGGRCDAKKTDIIVTRRGRDMNDEAMHGSNSCHQLSRKQATAVPEALDLSIALLQKRARFLRNSVVVVALTVLCSVATSMLFGSVLPLLGTVLLVPFSGLFVWVDGRCVAHWRDAILSRSSAGNLNLTAFRNALLQFKNLPSDTVCSMIALLPPDNSLRTEVKLQPAAKFAFRNIIISISLTLILGCPIVALHFKSWRPIIPATVLVPIFYGAIKCRNNVHD